MTVGTSICCTSSLIGLAAHLWQLTSVHNDNLDRLSRTALDAHPLWARAWLHIALTHSYMATRLYDLDAHSALGADATARFTPHTVGTTVAAMSSDDSFTRKRIKLTYFVGPGLPF